MENIANAAAAAIQCTAFSGQRRIASGELASVALKAKAIVDQYEYPEIFIFDDATGALIDVDFRGTLEQVVANLVQNAGEASFVSNPQPRRNPGRPKLGVIAREVTLLPGQWDWLNKQPGGASAALRRLVHEAKKEGKGKDRARQSQEAVYKFMTVMAGDLPGFEEALRAFYRKEGKRFSGLIEAWPKDIRAHVKKLVAAAAAPELI